MFVLYYYPKAFCAGGCRQLAMFSAANMPYNLNLFRFSLRVEAINYRPYACRSFEVASDVKNCDFGHYYYSFLYNKNTNDLFYA